MEKFKLPMEYNTNVEDIRDQEYPMLNDAIYLDHAGSTPPAKSLLTQFAADLNTTLYSNPHSASVSSQLTSSRVVDIRLRLLSFFGADPTEFDLVFTSNTTAAVKLVVEAFRAISGGFRYAYHQASHTSLVGVREEATESTCVYGCAVEDWIEGIAPLPFSGHPGPPILFAYPAQSHMDGRRYPLSWCSSIRSHASQQDTLFTLLDAASYSTTSPLHLSDLPTPPDFTVLSLHKLFGFPDLGALIVHKEAASVFESRRYFGGGTVEVAICDPREQWHISKQGALHERLEDGTLPFHGIIALDAAMGVHSRLFDTMQKVADHTSFLADRLYKGLEELRHANGQSVCTIYSPSRQRCSKGQATSGPIVAFNIKSQGNVWVSNVEFEKLAAIRNIHIRTGSLCCPGGSSAALALEPWEVRRNFSTGVKCGAESGGDIVAGKPAGMIRASIGPMSTISDVDHFVDFVSEFYREAAIPVEMGLPDTPESNIGGSCLRVKSLHVYPIKSCAGYNIPPETCWEVRPEGLAWDREWCVMHRGSGKALSQKQHPRMALLKPVLDFKAGILQVCYIDPSGQSPPREISVPLSQDPTFLEIQPFESQVCGDAIVAQRYTTDKVNDFFQDILGVPCVLARFPSGGSGRAMRTSAARIQRHQITQSSLVGSPPPSPPNSGHLQQPRILLSNESAMLMIYSPSVEAFNKDLESRGARPIRASAFRANVVLEPISTLQTNARSIISLFQTPSELPKAESRPAAYSEDFWQTLAIGDQQFELLGACRRCHMVCIDQDTAERNTEVFVTLAKTRRFADGKTYFGIHMRHADSCNVSTAAKSQFAAVSIGDEVLVT